MTSVSPAPAPRRRLLLSLLFAVYLVVLTWLVLWRLGTPWVGGGALRVVKLVPFAATAEAGASDPVEVALNLLLFLPFGLYLGLLAPSWPCGARRPCSRARAWRWRSPSTPWPSGAPTPPTSS